jgi:transposase
VKEQTYPTDLTDNQWDHIKELVPGAKPGGRRRTVEVREVINALLYVDNNGIKWRALPVMTRKANAFCLQRSPELKLTPTRQPFCSRYLPPCSD